MYGSATAGVVLLLCIKFDLVLRRTRVFLYFLIVPHESHSSSLYITKNVVLLYLIPK